MDHRASGLIGRCRRPYAIDSIGVAAPCMANSTVTGTLRLMLRRDNRAAVSSPAFSPVGL